MTESEIAFAGRVLRDLFALRGTLEALPGEHDLNFKVTADGQHYLLKIHPAVLAPERAKLQAEVLRHLEQRVPDLPIPRLFLGRSGETLPSAQDDAGRQRRIRLTTWLEGEAWVDAKSRGPESAASLGRLLARLDLILAEFHHPATRKPYPWDLALASRLLEESALIEDPERRTAAGEVLRRFAAEVEPKLGQQPKQVIHGDANDRNVLLDGAGRVSGLIDFGDIVESWRVNELAVASAYVIIGGGAPPDDPLGGDPLGAILPLIDAYCRENPIAEIEADALFDLILTRYAISMVMAARQSRQQPENAYLLVSQQEVWGGLQALLALNRPLAIARLRGACGFEPVAARRAIEGWILHHSHGFGPVLAAPLDRADLAVLPLGADHAAEVQTAARRCYAERVADALASSPGKTAIGRYGEDRSVYDAEAAAERRTIHLAVDLYADAGTVVLAPLPGRVAMVGNDAGAGGFGGVLVLEHESDAPHRFWTIYGHLAPASLADKTMGLAVERGARLAMLAAPSENGGWPPHLHFQLLTAPCFATAEAIFGVVAASQWDLWESVSPNPNQILGLPVDAAAIVARDNASLQRLRRKWFSPALSLAYREPLKIVAGEGATLIDAKGRRLLDMVNNVCHVGHGHPRVVEAIARQAARLNTNTRYLHDNLVEYAHRLTALLPEPLSTIFLVNSGSEANDLALRIARAYSGGTDVLVLDHAYHGNLSSLIDISPYKFDGPGGGGRPNHVWVAEMPDLYRGRIRAGEAEAGPRYADRIAVLLRDMSGLGRRLSAFFVEPLLGCGGQLVLPEGYLAAAFAEVRAAGGVCVADEVQVGFGRVGSQVWAFETQGVVPDIVTLGKPIGNGHPMGAVACRPEIAAAFATGMEYFNTFGGNPVSAAAGIAVLDVIRDERLMHNAASMGARLREGLRALAERHSLIGDVRGLGLFMGVELVRDRETLEPADREAESIVEAMREAGILLSTEGPHHNVLKIKPPLVISAKECDLFLEKLDGVLAQTI